jgi:hypothetical protein
LALSGVQIDLNAEALAMTRRKFEVPHGIFWPAIELFAGLFAHLKDHSRAHSARLHILQ